MLSIKADGMDFVGKRDGAVLLGNVEELLQRTNGASHGMNSLESHDLRNILVNFTQQFVEVLRIVVSGT